MEKGLMTTYRFNEQNPTCEKLSTGQLTWIIQQINFNERERKRALQ